MDEDIELVYCLRFVSLDLCCPWSVWTVVLDTVDQPCATLVAMATGFSGRLTADFYGFG